MPTFGCPMRREWMLDPDCTYLNHGTVGATPRRVLHEQQRLRDEMERHPSRFMLRELNLQQPAPWRSTSRLREAAEVIAGFVGARPADLVFVPSVTAGINAVLQSIPLASGDEVVVTDLAYGAIALAAAAACERSGAMVRTVPIDYPIGNPSDIIDAIDEAITPRSRLVVVDHVTAQTALVLPVADIAARCRARGVPVLVDGAHAPGAIALDITALRVDWYAANLHKWAHAPRSCGFLWAAPERQSILHYPVVSWGRNRGYLDEFERIATYDPTTALAAPAGIALLREWDFPACVEYMHALAREAAVMLTDCWHTAIDIPTQMTGAMVTVPLPPAAGSSDDDAMRLRLALLVEDQIEVHMYACRGALWARVSAQVYNDPSDIVRLAEAVARRTM